MSGTGIEGLSAAQKRALLERLLKEEASAKPLSAGQKALWFLHQLAPHSSAYNVAWSAVVRSPLDMAALARALRRLGERHEMLRVRFTTRSGEPVQRFAATSDPMLGEHDASGLTRAALEERLVAANNRPFDLVNGPVFRADVWHLGAAEHVLQLSVHHIAFDGWSTGIVVRDLMAFYAAETSAAAATLPAPPASFASYAAWQRDLVDGPAGQQMWEYWKERLGGALPVLALPTDHPRPAEPSYTGSKVSFLLGEDETQRLRQLAREQGATLFMTMLAVFGVLLHRYSDQDEVLIGSPTAGRSRTDFEGIVGYLVNPVVLRLSAAGAPTFAEYLARVRERVVEALRNADLPFPLLVQKLNPERDPSRSPLFQVDFTMLRVAQMGLDGGGGGAQGSLSRVTLGGLDLETFNIPQQEGQFDLALEVIDTGRELAGNLKYATDLFLPATAERMAGHLRQLVLSVVAAPGESVARLAMLTPAEIEALTHGPAAATTAMTRGAPLHERFAAQARLTPDATAATCEGRSLSYSELELRANQLARQLRTLGTRPNTLVGLRCERNLEMVVGILGILKSGAAYLPMDPAYPRDRLSFMLEDSATRIVVTDRAFAAEMRELVPDVVVIEEAAGDGAPLAAVGDSGDLAYVIYTSGSTGKPKGVEITHHNVGRLMDATHAWYGFDAADVWTLFHSYAFDFSVWELWGALLYGGRLVVVPQWVSRSPDAFRALLIDEQVTVLNQTPAAFRQLLATDLAAPPAAYSLRYVIFGGEALELQSLRPWFERYGDARPLLVNMYGITETTVHVTYRPIRMRDVEEGAGSVIGQPIPDLRVRLLDAHGGLVPIGVAGEMYIGGDGVARGYLGRPQLTAERFVADPFDPAAGRLYRSGDLARRLADGDLEYLGRIDHQVKIRGYRIELGEIEAAIAAMPGVREAFVIARDAGGDRRLAAYVTLRDSALGAGSAIKDALRTSLPEYMVPAHVVFLEALPLTDNGKVDRARLPAPQAVEPAARTFTPPRTPSEEIIAGLWAEVLGVERVGSDDDFFELGGHSLSVTQVVTRVRKVFGVAAPFRDLFAAPTLAAFAARIDAARPGARGAAPAAPLVAMPDAGQNPLSSAQQRLWFLNELGGDTAEYAIVGALEMTGELDVPALETALSQLTLRHESLRSVFASRDGEPVQVVTPAAAFALQVEELPEARVAERMKALATQRFDLQRGPLFRCTLYTIAADRHILQLVLHHIIADGWSIGVLMRDLGALYADAVLSRPPSLAPPLLQYRDYARWQGQQLDGQAHDGALARWQERLAGAPRELELPADRPRPPMETHRGAMHAFSLPADLTSGLRQLSRKQGTTLFMTLLALFDTLLWKYTGQEDLVVGTPVANRPRVELESLVGIFVNTLLLRTRLDASLSFADLLARVRETTLDSLGDEDVPFERLVEALRPERDLSRNPLFQVMFVLQNMPQRALELPGLVLAPRDVDRGAAQLDLTLYVKEADDGLAAFIEYASDLFDAERIARMAAHLEQLARAAVANPAVRLADMGLLTAAERANVHAWNATQQPAPVACVHDLIAAAAARQPHAPALLFGAQTITYAELDARATAVAARLAGAGVRRGSLVGVLLERGPDMVAGVLGVLKAGAAYVPMDPVFPADRLSYMLEDSGASVLLTQESLAASIATGATLLVMDRFADSDVLAAPAAATLDDLAYVIYTSGSTGKPKGVAIGHRSLMNLLLSMQREPGFAAADSLLAVTTLSFDIAGLELYLPLISGGRIVMASRDDVADGNALIERLEASGVSVMQATPATWRLMLEAGWQGNADLKVLCGGEALPRDLADVLAPRVRELWNVYGPTETTIWSSCERVNVEPGAVAIGRPIANTSLLILDRSGGLAPVGVPGELHIGGMGLAHGYWRRDELTAERFIPDAVSGQPGRLYKTGDQARWLGDGRVECLGRLDHQVKVRGYRIELEEIEIALREHPDVEQAVVVAQKGGGGDDRLVAYLIEVAGRPTNVTELRTHLRRKLPAYMVPSAFITIDSLPLTPNGKIDRKRLAELHDVGTANKSRTLPRTATERYLAEVWQQALGVQAVGLEDNFFDLGGHSLLAMRVLATIEKDTGTRLHPRDMIFQNLEQLAKSCDVRADDQPAGEPAPAGQGGLRGLLRRLRPGAAGGKR